jgi:hypothetical protein
MSKERERIGADDLAAWREWGPYLAERAWGTVREDYSPNGDAWNYFPHEHARSRAYRWNEDGIGGISDHLGRLCFGWAFWNGRDPILKERLFGLNNPEGNHGEDVKECYAYLDATPSHSWLQMAYAYPQAAFPYEDLVQTNAKRGKWEPEYELRDTGVFGQNRFFDLRFSYAKSSPNDILISIDITNWGDQAAELYVLPTLWFRNTWSWDFDQPRPRIRGGDAPKQIVAEQNELGSYLLLFDGEPELLFCDNETNDERLFGVPNRTAYQKDGIGRFLVEGEQTAVNPAMQGSKMALCYRLRLEAGQSQRLRFRLLASDQLQSSAIDPLQHDAAMAQAQSEADAFYAEIYPCSDPAKSAIFRQAMAGLIWNKQFYNYDLRRWLLGDPTQPPPAPERAQIRNSDWTHLYNEHVLSMPDAWEYPWYASWDLAFHTIPFALIDPAFAKEQLEHLGREWYQHPNGQLPAYEWALGDVNPPVQAWAAWRVYKIEERHWGQKDLLFLKRIFHKQLLYFTWWVNRKDKEGNNLFGGGFLGLDNIGVFDRNAELPGGGFLEQSDGTSWMAMYCLDMLTISLELAQHDIAYEAIATKFLEHFLAIAVALNNLGGDGIPLWNEEDGFFYDVLHLPNGSYQTMRVRSFVGLIPLFAVMVLEPSTLEALPEFRKRLEWYLEHRPDLAALVSHWEVPGSGQRRLLALCRGHRMKLLLRRALDSNEFLSEYGLRSLSKYHAEHPYIFNTERDEYQVHYEPGESRSGSFGGNSNWRGPIWFPVNFMLIEALQRFHHYYGDDFIVEHPTGSGQMRTLLQIADDLRDRLFALFEADSAGKRPYLGDDPLFGPNGPWRDFRLFFEYFHGESGLGLGASHQTGWTALIAKLLHQAERTSMWKS